MKIIKNCPLCGNNIFESIFNTTFSDPGDDVRSNLLDRNYVRLWILFKHILKNESSLRVDFMICKNCGFIFINPRLEEEDIKIKYDLINKLGSVKARLAKNPVKNSERFEKFLYRSIVRYKNNRFTGHKILDFGGADGNYLRLFANDNQCYIVDYERWDLLKGVEYLCQTVDEIPKDMKFDIIMSCNTFEHLVDPVQMLQKLATFLKPKGLFYILVPFGCQRFSFKEWREPITHINFFSSASISYLILSCGLTKKRIWEPWQYYFHNNRSLLLSIIATKDEVNSSEYKYGDGYKATIRQMKNPIYYLHDKARYLKKYFVMNIKRFNA